MLVNKRQKVAVAELGEEGLDTCRKLAREHVT